jgi:hypothetical protein
VTFPHQLQADEVGFHWNKRQEVDRHLVGLDGDHLSTPFQCDLCIFPNLMGRNPGKQDKLLQACIRQVNLDALWGRERATIEATVSAVKHTVSMLSMVRVMPPYPPSGPHPVEDNLGYSVAIAMVLKSRTPGQYAHYQQFETIRKLRAGYSNVFMASVGGVQSLRTVGGERAKHYLNQCPTHLLWFERFSKGCLSRMGQIVKQDLAISLDIMHALMDSLLAEWNQSTSQDRKVRIASVGAYSIIAFCGLFRGAEVLMVDLYGLRKYFEESPRAGSVDFVVIPLLGRLKIEVGTQYHLMPMAARMDSGLDIWGWIGWLLEVRERQGRHQGPAFCLPHREVDSMRNLEQDILERLLMIQEARPELISKEVQVYEEYGVNRSFQRGATSEARTRGVAPEDIDLINR